MHAPPIAPNPVRNPRTRRRARTLGALVVAGALTVGLAACGSSSSDEDAPDVPTVVPASASPAPAGPARPVGVVVPGPAGASALALSGRTLAVLDRAGTAVHRYGVDTLTAPAAVTPTPRLTELVATGDGGLLGVGPRVAVRIDRLGAVTTTDLDVTDPTALATTAAGEVLIGTANGHVLVYDRDLRRQRDIGGFVRVDEITVSPVGADIGGDQGDKQQVVVLDRAQSSVTPVDIASGDLRPALRAGNGATTATVDHYGRVSVANTRDGEIIGFFGSPMVMRFRYPVPGGPYAVDFDDTRNLLWVSTTANNEVVAYDLATGEPAQRRKFGAVAQPDRLVVDDRSGTVFVVSGRDGSIQAVAPTTPDSQTPPDSPAAPESTAASTTPPPPGG